MGEGELSVSIPWAIVLGGVFGTVQIFGRLALSWTGQDPTTRVTRRVEALAARHKELTHAVDRLAHQVERSNNETVKEILNQVSATNSKLEELSRTPPNVSGT